MPGSRRILGLRAVGLRCAGAVLALAPLCASADGFVVDKIYHPYVNPIEREIEFRSLLIADSDPALDDSQFYRLGFARAFAERFRGEVYLIGRNLPSDNLGLSAYELELKWQLTEQGEYFADWGLLFELEGERDEDVTEFVSSVLVEKELGQWAATLNLAVVYEWGDDIENELEAELGAQLRYRYTLQFEPAIELYSGDAFKGIGPVGLGQIRFGQGRKLRWELGAIFGVASDSPDLILRGMFEYEF